MLVGYPVEQVSQEDVVGCSVFRLLPVEKVNRPNIFAFQIC